MYCTQDEGIAHMQAGLPVMVPYALYVLGVI